MSASKGCSSVMPVSTSTRAIGMVDDVHVDRHHLALDVEVGDEDWRDGDRGGSCCHRTPS